MIVLFAQFSVALHFLPCLFCLDALVSFAGLLIGSLLFGLPVGLLLPELLFTLAYVPGLGPGSKGQDEYQHTEKNVSNS